MSGAIKMRREGKWTEKKGRDENGSGTWDYILIKSGTRVGLEWV